MFLTRKRSIPAQRGQAGWSHSTTADLLLRMEAVVLRCLWWISLRLDPERASDAGAWLMRHLTGPKSRVTRRMRRNFKIALESEDDETIDAVTQEAVVNLARTVLEYPHLRHMASSDPKRFVEFTAKAPETALSQDRPPAIYIGMHQANWEVMASASALLGKPMTIVVSPLSNPYVHRQVSAARPDRWALQAERDNAMRTLMRSLKRGSSIGMLADQRFEGGGLIPFFGRDAMTALGPAKLALKVGCELIPMRIERLGPLRFRITTFAAIHPADEVRDDPDKAAIDMMVQVNRYFESWIRDKPGQWMCMKRRWPVAAYEGAD